MKYFGYATGLTMINKKFSNLFGQEVRNPKKDLLTQFHMDIASSIQTVIEDIIIKLISSLSKEIKTDNLCLAGGVSLNSVFTGKLVSNNGKIKNVFIPPVPYDAGLSIGACQYHWYSFLKMPRVYDSFVSPYLGESYSKDDVMNTINSFKL